MSTVSVIIPTRNAGPRFAEVLASLRRQRVGAAVEIIVLDSESTDATAQMARRAGARVEMVARARFNHGGTRNRGIELSGGEFLVLLSQDAMPADDHLLARLCADFADPRVAGVFARQEPRPEHSLLVQRNVRETSGSPRRQESVIIDQAAYENLLPRERLAFCRFDNVCSSVRRTVWERLPFPERDFAEDLGWSQRVLETGWKIIYDPEACVVHSHDLSLAAHYRRCWQTHRALRELFGLKLIGSRRNMLRQWWLQAAADGAWVSKNEHGLLRKAFAAGAVPARALATVLGTYRGARSADRAGLAPAAGDRVPETNVDGSARRQSVEGAHRALASAPETRP